MGALDKEYERKHVNSVLRTENETLRIINKAIEKVSKDINKYQAKRKLTPDKFAASIKRNKNIQKSLIAYREELAKSLNDAMQYKIAYNWDLAEQKNDLLTKDYVGSIPPQFDRVPRAALDSFISRKENGLKLSEKLWNTSNSSMRLIEDQLGTGISQGKSAVRIAGDITEMMRNPQNYKYVNADGEIEKFKNVSDFLNRPVQKGQYKNPYQAAKRLARNETNLAYRNADFERIQKLDFVVGKRVHLSNAHADIDICDNLAGDYPKTFIFSGWHPNCLCYVTTILATKEEFRNGKASKNTVYQMPLKTERLAKTIANGDLPNANSLNKSYWMQNNFKDGVAKINPRQGVERYKTKRNLSYEANQSGYLQNAKKGLD